MGVFILLRPVWEWTGLQEVYRTIVVGVAQTTMIRTQHFPTVVSFSNLTTRNIDFVALLALSLMLVSTRLAWPRRLGLFGGALAVIVAFQVVLLVLSVGMRTAQELEQTRQILVLSPWEFQFFTQLKTVLYDFGQPATMFALFVVTFASNTGLIFGPRTGSTLEGRRAQVRRPRLRTALALVLCVAAASVIGWTVWRRWREANPRHVEAHAKIGHLYWLGGDKATADEQYRIAVAGGTVDPEVFYNLAALARAGGRIEESRAWLRRCAELASDSACSNASGWRAR